MQLFDAVGRTTRATSDVTVVIPTKNRRELLLETLETVLSQRGVELSVIVVDDGSSNGTSSALAQRADPRLTVLRNAQSKGVAEARNQGLACVTTGWTAFLDDDDLWAPDKLQRQIGAATESDAHWSYAGAVAIELRGGWRGSGPPPEPQALVEALPVRNIVPAGASNVLARTELVRGVGGFDPQLRHLADWDLWIRLARDSVPAVVRSPLVAYRIHGASASRDLKGLMDEIRAVDERYRDQRKGRPLDRGYLFRWAAWNCLMSGERWKALSWYTRAVRAGDLLSGLRIVTALLWPGLGRGGLHRHRDRTWEQKAERWPTC